MSFWTSKGSNPKRKFRFMVTIGGAGWSGDTEIWYAKSCTAPSVEVSSVEHMFSDHVFNFPGKAKWGDVEMVLVDPAGGGLEAAEDTTNTVRNFNELLKTFGYEIPSDGNDSSNYGTISRNKVQALNIHIKALDDNGDTIEDWTLHNAFPISFKYGDFDYNADDLREMNVTWKYDWAEAKAKGAPSPFFGRGA